MTTNQMIAKAIEDKAKILARNELENEKYQQVQLVQKFCHENNISKENLKNIVDEITNPTQVEPPKELVEDKKKEIIEQLLNNFGETEKC